MSFHIVLHLSLYKSLATRMHDHIFLVSMCFPVLLIHHVLPGSYMCSPKIYSVLRLSHVEFTDSSVKRDATLCHLSDTDEFLSSVSEMSPLCYCELFSGASPLPNRCVCLRSSYKESIGGVSISCIQCTMHKVQRRKNCRCIPCCDRTLSLATKTKQSSICLNIILY